MWRASPALHAKNTSLYLLLILASFPVSGQESEARPWEKIKLPEEAAARNLNSVFFLDANLGWIVGEKGLCLLTLDGGHTWAAAATGSTATLRDVRFKDAQNGWACGDGDEKAFPSKKGHLVMSRPLLSGTLLGTTDGGKTWTVSWVPTNFVINCVEISAAPILQVGISGGGTHLDGDITRTDYNEKNWTVRRCYRALFDIAAITESAWVAVGSPVSVGFIPRPSEATYTNKDCRALLSKDGGKSWNVSKGSNGNGCLRSIAIGKGSLLLAAGDQGAILYSQNSGADWKAAKSGTTENLNGIACHQERAVALAVGMKGTVIVGTGECTEWKELQALPVNLNGVSVAGDSLIAVGDKGAVFIARIEKLVSK